MINQSTGPNMTENIKLQPKKGILKNKNTKYASKF